ncbi:hypothetical protein D3C76_1670350 [compost metagenome]
MSTPYIEMHCSGIASQLPGKQLNLVIKDISQDDFRSPRDEGDSFRCPHALTSPSD